MRAAAVLALAACYAPDVPSEVTCDPDRPVCPHGQSCVRRGGKPVCSAFPEDPPEANDAGPEANDNCPGVKNPSQDNFDGDDFGDACDPCPPIANNAPIDSDADGVSNDCDPDPLSPGDTIVRFEGFRHGLGAWTADGPWTVGPDGARIDLAAGARASLVMPAPAGSRVSVIAAVTPNELRGGPTYAGMGVIDEAIACQLVVDPLGQRRLSIINTTLEAGLAGDPYAFANGARELAILTRIGADFRCRATAAEVTARSMLPGAPEIGVRVRDARGVIHWILVIAKQASG